MTAELRTLSNRARTHVLRIDAFDERAAALLCAGGFDAVELGSDLPDFEPLIPHADVVRWLWSSAPRSTRGLERLQQIERITYTGSQAGPNFDFRQLVRLKTLECDAADAMSAKYLNHSALEIMDAAKLADVSALRSLHRLRWIFVDARTAEQPDIGWLADAPALECAGLWFATLHVDWAVLAAHPTSLQGRLLP